jgi:hypothetical protein
MPYIRLVSLILIAACSSNGASTFPAVRGSGRSRPIPNSPIG